MAKGKDRWPWLLPLAASVTGAVWDRYGPEARVWGVVGWMIVGAVWLGWIATRPSVTARRQSLPKRARWLADTVLVTMLALLGLLSYRSQPDWRTEGPRPAFVVSIDAYWSNLGDHTIPPDKRTIVLVASIRNTGAPSAAENFELYVGPPPDPALSTKALGAQMRSVELEPMPDRLRIDGLTFFSEDDLSRKAHQKIETGASVQGVLIFNAKHLDPDRTVTASQLTLVIDDAWGRYHFDTVTAATGGEMPARPVFPGLSRQPAP